MRGKPVMSKKFLIFFSLIILAVGTSCNFPRTQHEIMNSLPATGPDGPPPKSSRGIDSICWRLKELKTIPYDYEKVAVDPIYDGLRDQGDKVIPCLVDQITDTTIMPDPRQGDPQIEDFRVGDAAVFMLLIISKENHPEKMLPPHYAKRWETEGIYSYFAYVEKPANRERLRAWWNDWIKEYLNEGKHGNSVLKP